MERLTVESSGGMGSLHVGWKEMDAIGDPSTGLEVHIFGSHFSLASGLISFLYHLSGPGLAQEVIGEEHELCINLSLSVNSPGTQQTATSRQLIGVRTPCLALGAVAPRPCFQLTILSWLPASD